MSLYVTVDEFKQAPTAVDVSALDQTNLGNQAAQDNALFNILSRASSWVDNICRVNTLTATTNTETKEINLGRDGRLTVHVDNVPIIQLTSVGYRMTPNVPFANVDLQYVQIMKNWFTVYNVNSNTLSPALTLQNSFGYYSPWQRQQLSDMPLTVQYTYVNGFMNTVLTNDANVGDTTVTVNDSTGVVVGTAFTIFDGPSEENCVAASVNGNVITLQNPLMFDHFSNTSVSALPAAVKQATILLASYLIKERGSMALTMSETVASGTSIGYNRSSDIEIAKQLLRPFVRVVSSG